MSGNLDLNKLDKVVVKDILELQKNIELFKTGQMHEEKFKHYRLTRGVYGQRQLGVQMFRTKIPFGKITTDQLIRLAEVSEKYTNGNLHITTRQNIQMHYVKVEDSPAIWTELSQVGVTAREACGNTVRNITGSPHAGIDPNELFDISPYVQSTYEFFLRNPICQEMGRKIKIAFSSSDMDTALTYFHDFGFIPRVQDGERGFKLVVGGGIGAVSIVAITAFEFIHEDEIIPFLEAAVRVFDRHGEREKRFKARMKFLVKGLGLEEWLRLVDAERKAIPHQKVKINRNAVPTVIPEKLDLDAIAPNNPEKYDLWLKSNIYGQKQKGFFAAQIRIVKGDIQGDKAKKLAKIIKKYAADDIRLSVNQGMIIKFLRKEYLPNVFNELDAIGLAEPGFDTLADVTSCPGTDTCVLGVTNSTGLALELERLVKEDFPQFVDDRNIKMKVSGCMNACGQHMIANIGFHGSSIKKRPLVIPAMQIVLGGGVDQNGKGFIAEKVIKVPTKRIPVAVTRILNDYEEHAKDGQYFNDYYYERGKIYFYDLLKSLGNVEGIKEEEFRDWGQEHDYKQEIGVGECAGAAFDVVSSIINDAKEKINQSKITLEQEDWSGAIFYAYTGFVISAKALLLIEDVKCNTHIGIIKDFQSTFVESGKIKSIENFHDLVLQINKFEPNEAFAKNYQNQAKGFFDLVVAYRDDKLSGGDKNVIESHYKA